MHVEEEHVQRMLHGELDEATLGAVTRHVADCAPCAERVEAARREERWLLGVLRAVDHAAPEVLLEPLVRRARRRPRAWYWQRRAAALLLAAGTATVAYALPGSPLPGWARRVARWVSGTAQRDLGSPRLPADSVSGSAVADVGSGIALAISDRLTIRFAAAQPTGTATLTLVDSARVFVRVLRGRASFTMSGDYLTIDNTGSQADYAIEVPRTARLVDVRVADRWILTLQAGRLTTGPGVERGRAGQVSIRLGPATR